MPGFQRTRNARNSRSPAQFATHGRCRARLNPSPRRGVRAAPPAPERRAVLGVPLALTDYDGTLDWIDAAVADRRRGYVCVAAVHTVMACREDPALRAAVLGADFTVPDGQPLVWALTLLGPPAPRTASTGRS